MKVIDKIVLGLLGVMSLAAGAAKVLQVPEEAQFFAEAGIASSAMVIFGVVQIVAGVLLLLQVTRLAGALIAAIMFASSATMIFMTGNLQFGLVAALPVLMACYVAWQAGNAR